MRRGTADYYILTLAAIGKELRRRSLASAKIILAAGLPLTWADRQREQFKAYLSKNAHVDFTYQDMAFHADIEEVFVFYQGVAAVAHRLGQFKGTNMLADIGNGKLQTPWVCKSASRTEPVELEIRAARSPLTC